MADSSLTVVAPPDLDAASAAAFALELTMAERDAQVLVDCSGVDFIDSSGIRALVVAHNQLTTSGGSLSIVRPTRVVRRVVELCGLDYLLEPVTDPA